MVLHHLICLTCFQWPLRSSGVSLLVVPKCRNKTFGRYCLGLPILLCFQLVFTVHICFTFLSACLSPIKLFELHCNLYKRCYTNKVWYWWLGVRCVRVRCVKCLCRKLWPFMSIKGNVCVQRNVCLHARLNPVLPTPLPLWVALDFHRFHSCSQQCTPLHLKSLKRSEAPKDPSAANSPWLCGSSRENKNKETLQHLILV